MSCFWLTIVAKVPALLNLMPALELAPKGKNGRYVPALSGEAAVYQSVCNHRLTQGSDWNERLSKT
jgi:hypothetical protein